MDEEVAEATARYNDSRKPLDALLKKSGVPSPFIELHSLFRNSRYPRDTVIGNGVTLGQLEDAKDAAQPYFVDLQNLLARRDDIMAYRSQPLLRSRSPGPRQVNNGPFSLPELEQPFNMFTRRPPPPYVHDGVSSLFAPAPRGVYPGSAPRRGGAKRTKRTKRAKRQTKKRSKRRS